MFWEVHLCFSQESQEEKDSLCRHQWLRQQFHSTYTGRLCLPTPQVWRNALFVFYLWLYLGQPAEKKKLRIQTTGLKSNIRKIWMLSTYSTLQCGQNYINERHSVLLHTRTQDFWQEFCQNKLLLAILKERIHWLICNVYVTITFDFQNLSNCCTISWHKEGQHKLDKSHADIRLSLEDWYNKM